MKVVYCIVIPLCRFIEFDELYHLFHSVGVKPQMTQHIIIF